MDLRVPRVCVCEACGELCAEMCVRVCYVHDSLYACKDVLKGVCVCVKVFRDRVYERAGV